MSAATFTQARHAFAMAKADVDALGSDYADVEADFYGDVQFKALDALMLAPAPDLAALAYKLEVFDAEDCCDLSRHIRDPLFSALVADVRRIGRLDDDLAAAKE